ncbi:hypothetical protein B9Z19DRAFT_976980 [Tuber borchii]|uniref:E3 ubiquitin-protein ligase listerin n=1 Tax=Tuber borchii TaxID=42251 RepID=A0A2T6ZWS5_TUBBO|nr:hypothetical protein B9Z19DRAFT_976980 [Tuber borchii]
MSKKKSSSRGGSSSSSRRGGAASARGGKNAGSRNEDNDSARNNKASPGPSSKAPYVPAVSPLSYTSEGPDLSGVSDPSMVVLLKLLSKKDETTKSKALEDLQAKIAGLGGVEDIVLAAWIRLYPRLSTDISVGVRRLAHIVHGIISQKSGKKVARHMSEVVGPWLAGLYDSDRGSARAAAESLNAVFGTQEKIRNVWVAYQPDILDYCSNVIEDETVNSLSDERQFSSDEAESKFARVIATCVHTVAHLISQLPPEEIEKQSEKYEELLGKARFWEFGGYDDPYLRKSIYRLLRACLTSQEGFILSSLEVVANALMVKALTSPQTGSVTELLDAILDLTSHTYKAWISVTPPLQKTPLSLVIEFIKCGSQGGSPEYWHKVSKMITLMPREILPKDVEGVTELITSILDGLWGGPEPRSHVTAAWDAYFRVCYHMMATGEVDTQDEVTAHILRDALYPVFEGFLLKNAENAQFRLPHFGAEICATGITMAGAMADTQIANLVVKEVWEKLERSIADNINPDIDQKAHSPDDRANRRHKWVDFSAEIFKRDSNSVVNLVKESIAKMLLLNLDRVIKGKGENVEVTLLLESLLMRCPQVLKIEEVKRSVVSFFADHAPELMSSPSWKQVLSGLIACASKAAGEESFQRAWDRNIRELLVSSLEKERKEAAVIQLFMSTPALLQGKLPFVQELDTYVVNKMRESINTNNAMGWEIMRAAMASSGTVISEAIVAAMLLELSNSLSPEEGDRTIRVLEQLRLVPKGALAEFARSESGVEFLSTLLVLSGSPSEDIADAAGRLNKILEKELSNNSGALVGSLLDALLESVLEPKDSDPSLSFLAERAHDLVRRAPEDEQAALAEKVFFNEDQWRSDLNPFLKKAPRPSLAISNPIGGAVFLVKALQDDTSSEEIVRDLDGLSRVLRMAVFVVKFLKTMGVLERKDEKAANILKAITDGSRVALLKYLMLVSILANDNIAIKESNDLWNQYSSGMEAEMLEFVFEAQRFFFKSLKDEPKPEAGEADKIPAYIFRLLDCLMDISKQETPEGFYSARILEAMISTLSEDRKISPDQSQSWLKSIDIRKGQDIHRSIAILTGLGESLERTQEAEKLRNGLASDMTGIPASKAGEAGLRKIVLLNAALPKPGQDTPPLPQQRAIFLIKHLLSWFGDEAFAVNPSRSVIVEASKAIATVLPVVKELYGEHWELLCEYVANCWAMCTSVEEADLPVIFASLKLFQVLKSLHKENDDFEDAWDKQADVMHTSLMGLLRSSRAGDEHDQPRNLCNALLARLTKGIDLKYIGSPEETYSLLNVPSRSIQEAAFEILHRHIPSVQEEVSVEAALSKEENFELSLPQELLSLAMEPPTGDGALKLDSERGMSWSLRGYLLAWILIFDHFENSALTNISQQSFKVRTAYVEALKDADLLTPLFNYTFDILGHSRGKPIDASKLPFETYTLDSSLEDSTNPVREVHWLLTHIYYLALRHTPSLVKRWWTECKSRQKVLAVEEFTEKYMSPLLIERELSSVQAWIQSHSGGGVRGGEEDEMTVKILKALTIEVTATYPIDDQSMEMRVRIPPTFPLRQVEVEGARRVGLTEKDFRKMQLASQTVINFQSASIIDGLTLFRKNLALHFEGVAECAICYSIVAVTPDRKLPNKACATCRNKFHGTCLFKWFKSSNSASCPLCRTAFSMYS